MFGRPGCLAGGANAVVTRQWLNGGTLDAAEYRHLIDQLPDLALLVADPGLRIVLAGGQALARSGWRAGEILGRRPRDLLPAPIAAEVESHLAAALRGQASTMPVLPGSRADIVWEARFGPLRGADSEATGVIFLLRDVTAQQRLGARARASEARFRATVDALLDALGVLSAVRDQSGRIVDLRAEYANPVACRLFQRSLAELIGQRVLDVLPSLADLGLFGKLVHTIETGEPLDFEVPWFEEDVVAGAFEVRAAKLGDGAIVAFRDVTSRVEADRRLRASEERYRVTVESAAAGVANVGMDGRFRRVNRRFCEITGYSEPELLALTFQDITHPGDLAVDVTQARQLAAGEIPWYAMQKRYLRKDGSVIWVLLTGAVLRDNEGGAYEYVATVTDITAQKQAQDKVTRLNAELEERVRERTADLEEANANLEAFTYTVSHDLRTPLTALVGFSRLLSQEYGDQLTGPGAVYVDRIQSASQRMDDLIGDLLVLSRASRAEIHATTVDLSGIARATVAALRSRDPGRQVAVSVRGGVAARGDPELLRTVLENLLGNAWKFTSHTDQAAISFGTLPAGPGLVHCYVRDNGAGFDPEQTGQLFRPFTRLHDAREFPGTGVGLASVHRIVTRHQGR